MGNKGEEAWSSQESVQEGGGNRTGHCPVVAIEIIKKRKEAKYRRGIMPQPFSPPLLGT